MTRLYFTSDHLSNCLCVRVRGLTTSLRVIYVTFVPCERKRLPENDVTFLGSVAIGASLAWLLAVYIYASCETEKPRDFCTKTREEMKDYDDT